MSEYNIYFGRNPVRGDISICSLPTQYYLGQIEERLGIRMPSPGLMRISKLFDYDPVKLADMDRKTLGELRYIDIT